MEPTKAPWALARGDQTGVGHSGAANQATNFASSAARRPAPYLIKANPAMPAPLMHVDGRVWQPASRHITSQQDMEAFLRSDAAREFVAFLMSLNEAVKGQTLSAQAFVSDSCQALLRMLDRIDAMVSEVPPAAQAMRYGNPAFRKLYAAIESRAESMLEEVLPETWKGAAVELAPYLVESFGNATRIDYGTGHETNLAALLFCLAKLGVVTDADRKALVLRVFKRYLDLVRRIQTTYWLEPAGSQGVWGLDDYQFLPFFWGAAQLVDHPLLQPSSIHNERYLEEFSSEYLYFGCVAFVKSVKKGPLAETSPMLNDISGVVSWSKVNVGMMKMYQAEVLAKLPVVQHFLFGSVFGWPPERVAAARPPQPVAIAPSR